MTLWPTLLAIAAMAYFVGAIPIGYILARLRGVDIFSQGSGNIGATNVGRVLGARWGLLVFVLDFAKGAGPTLAARFYANAAGLEPASLAPIAAGMVAFLGHLFPIYLGFRGGKGVATGTGVVAVLLPGPTLAALVAWIAVVSASRYISLGSIVASIVLCAARVLWTPEPFGDDGLILTLLCLLASFLVVVKHRKNLSRLHRGDENRLADGPGMRLVTKTVHVLAVGLWFGMAVFFSFPVALSLFGSFEALAQQNERPSWFPLPDQYKSDPAFQKEQGTRAAGFVVSPLFDHYFLWQGICGLLAAGTALGWSRAQPGRRVHAIRGLVLMGALATVVVAWPIERKVSELRHARNAASDLVMQQATVSPPMPSGQLKAEWDSARGNEFATWHLWSLLLNFLTILLVTIAMALTAQLPGDGRLQS